MSECESDDDSGSGFGSFDGAPAKSALTSYSMTSSVLPRNEKLSLLDDMFEKVGLRLSFLLCEPVLYHFLSELFANNWNDKHCDTVVWLITWPVISTI